MKGLIQVVDTGNNGNFFERESTLSLSLSLDKPAHNVDSLSANSITSIKALTEAWKKFSRGKKSRKDVGDYQKDLKHNLEVLQERLQTGRYRHYPYQLFVIHDPKQRQIYKATVADRIVHQAIVTAIEPFFESRFIYDSYSCRIGKGTHVGVARLQTFLRRASQNKTQKVYVLKCDVRKFFA